MNGRDFAREYERLRRERLRQMAENPDPHNVRRLALIQEMEQNAGRLDEPKLAELRALQRRFNLPSDF